MANLLGVAAAGLQLGLDSIIVKPFRAIGPFTAQVTLSEEHEDELEITDHPVDQGGFVSDHAFKRPATVRIECMWSNSPSPGLLASLAAPITGTITGIQSIITGNAPNQVRDLYQKLLALQSSKIPFSVYTGKRIYDNMLVRSLKVETNKETENSLSVVAVLRQVLIAQVTVSTISAPKENQKEPESTMPQSDVGTKQPASAPNFNEDAAERALAREDHE